MEQLPEAIDSTDIASHLEPFSDMIPLVVAGLVGVLVILLVISIMSARRQNRQYKAIIQTAEDTRAIRELLESQQKPQIRPRPPELSDDPQLPPRP